MDNEEVLDTTATEEKQATPYKTFESQSDLDSYTDKRVAKALETARSKWNNELDTKLEIIKEELMERFQKQEDKRVYNFPFLVGQGIWMDSEKLKPYDRLRRINKHGTLSIGMLGITECLVA